jgi:hypothetical protein
MILFTASELPFHIAFHTTMAFFTEETAARAPAMRDFLDAGPDGRRAFATGMSGGVCRDCQSSSFWPAVLCHGVLRDAAGRRGGGIAGREEGFWAIPGCLAWHPGGEKSE